MQTNFLRKYLEALPSIPGWFSPDANFMFIAYNEIITRNGIVGDTLEIGVHHGKSAIGVASLRGPQRTFFASDLFDDLQSLNNSGSGMGNKAAFLSNMERFYGDISFVRLLVGESVHLRPEDIGRNFSFCHIDGGHSAIETYNDVSLCSDILIPGGLVALDDYFNPSFPGVSEGAIRFMIKHKNLLTPVAIGFNKVLFQKLPTSFVLQREFSEWFPYVPKREVEFWGKSAYLFDTGFVPFFDIEASTPNQLVENSALELAASIRPLVDSLRGQPGETITMPVSVTNNSSISFHSNISLSYHLLLADGTMIQWDNRRVGFDMPLHPEGASTIQLPVAVPSSAGSYSVAVDLVWEGVTWFGARGNVSPCLDLVVTP